MNAFWGLEYFYLRRAHLDGMIGIILALLSAATSALSVILVRRHSKSSNTFNISLIISLSGPGYFVADGVGVNRLFRR